MEKTSKKKLKPGLLIFLCWLVYTCSCLGKYSYTSNITLIEQAFSVTHAESGLVTTLFFFSYGIGQIVNGIFCKRYNKRLVLGGALIISSGINLAVGLGLPFFLVKYFWLVNGIVLSVLWSSTVSVLSEHLDEKNLKKAILAMATTLPVGTGLSYGITAIFSLTGKYNISFLLGGSIILAVGVVWILLYNKKRFEVQEDLAGEMVKLPVEKAPKKKMGLALLVLIGLLALFAIITNLIKDGLQTWVPAILKDSFSLSDSLSIILTVVLPVLGMFGSFIAIYLYKYVKNYVFLSGIFFTVATLCIFGVTMLMNTSLWILVLLLFGVTAMCMSAINNVITSMMPMYSRDKLNSGMISGVLNGFCYVGSTLSSYGLGAIADSNGWDSVFTVLLIACAVSVVTAIVFLITNIIIQKRVQSKKL